MLSQVAQPVPAVGAAPGPPDLGFLATYIRNGLRFAPASTRTPIQGVHRLPGGHVLTLDVEQGHAGLRPYWRVPTWHAEPMALATAIARLGETLTEAVRERMAHGPTAISLSGGIDSGSVAYFAAQCAPARAFCLTQTFTPLPELQEVAGAHRTAHGVGLPLHVAQCDGRRAFAQLEPGMVYTHGLPVDPLTEMQETLAETAQRLGAKVMLCGVGGDELFGMHHHPSYLLSLLGARQWRRAAAHLWAWTRHGQQPPWAVLRRAMRPEPWRPPARPPWMSLPAHLELPLCDPGVGVPPSVRQRVRHLRWYLDFTEDWWNRTAVMAPRGIKLLHPLHTREVLEVSLAIPQWLVQNPSEYKWLLRRLMEARWPQAEFALAGMDYAPWIEHGVRAASARLWSYFEHDCRLIKHGIADRGVCDVIKAFLRDPCGMDWSPADGDAYVAQHALWVEMWLRGREEATR